MTHRSDAAFRGSHELSGPHRSRRVIAGQGMLTPVQDFTWRGDRWVADRDRVVPEHDAVQEHPLRFTPCYPKEDSSAVLAFLERKRALRQREPWRLGPSRAKRPTQPKLARSEPPPGPREPFPGGVSRRLRGWDARHGALGAGGVDVRGARFGWLPARYCAGDVAGEREDRARRLCFAVTCDESHPRVPAKRVRVGRE
jgi:hypothetical protein